MRGEAPRFKRCCFCIPLRRALLGWGYLILALNLLKAILFLVLYFAEIVIYHLLLPSIVLMIVDIVFSVLLIVACHKKSSILLKIYFVYGIVAIVLEFASTMVIIYDEIQTAVRIWDAVSGLGENIVGVLATPASCFVYIFIYIYVLLLVRSERLKLREQNLEVQFVNNGAEAESYCVCVADAAKSARDLHDPPLCNI